MGRLRQILAAPVMLIAKAYSADTYRERCDRLEGELRDARDRLEQLRSQVALLRGEQRRAEAAERELAELRALYTPRRYERGQPAPQGYVLRWHGSAGWCLELARASLSPGDIWLPEPPPPPDKT